MSLRTSFREEEAATGGGLRGSQQRLVLVVPDGVVIVFAVFVFSAGYVEPHAGGVVRGVARRAVGGLRIGELPRAGSFRAKGDESGGLRCKTAARP